MATYRNLDIFVIDSVLAIPGNLSTAVSALKLTNLASLVSMIPFTSGELSLLPCVRSRLMRRNYLANGTNETLLGLFEGAKG